MARARNIKPGLFKNELLGVADPLLTLLFQSLWCLADREGRLEDRPLRIKAETFPYRENLDVNVYLTELERLGFICRYEAVGERYIQVLNFAKHQNPHKTEKASEMPEMPEKSVSCSASVNPPLNNGTHPADSLIPDSLIPDTGITLSGNQLAPSDQDGAKPKKSFGSKRDHEAAKWMYECVLVVNATAKEPNWDSWANEIRLMREQDKRTHEQICDLFGWANTDTFWRTNVMCPAKLREKWDQLTAKRADKRAGRSSKPDNFVLGDVDHSSSQEAMKATMDRLGLETPPEGTEIKF